jgi:hypothetical protein
MLENGFSRSLGSTGRSRYQCQPQVSASRVLAQYCTRRWRIIPDIRIHSMLRVRTTGATAGAQGSLNRSPGTRVILRLWRRLVVVQQSRANATRIRYDLCETCSRCIVGGSNANRATSRGWRDKMDLMVRYCSSHSHRGSVASH